MNSVIASVRNQEVPHSIAGTKIVSMLRGFVVYLRWWWPVIRVINNTLITVTPHCSPCRVTLARSGPCGDRAGFHTILPSSSQGEAVHFQNGDRFWPSLCISQFWAHSARVEAIQHAAAQCAENSSKSRVKTEPSLSWGEQCHVGEMQKRKFCVPRFVSYNKHDGRRVRRIYRRQLFPCA